MIAEIGESPHVHKELLRNTVELVTGICETTGEAIEDLGHLEGFSHMGSFLILGAHLDEAYADRVREITAAYDRARAGTTRGNRHGVSWLMVRALANSTQELNDILLDINELDRKVTGTGQSRLNLRRY